MEKREKNVKLRLTKEAWTKQRLNKEKRKRMQEVVRGDNNLGRNKD